MNTLKTDIQKIVVVQWNIIIIKGSGACCIKAKIMRFHCTVRVIKFIQWCSTNQYNITNLITFSM